MGTEYSYKLFRVVIWFLGGCGVLVANSFAAYFTLANSHTLREIAESVLGLFLLQLIYIYGCCVSYAIIVDDNAASRYYRSFTSFFAVTIADILMPMLTPLWLLIYLLARLFRSGRMRIYYSIGVPTSYKHWKYMFVSINNMGLEAVLNQITTQD